MKKITKVLPLGETAEVNLSTLELPYLAKVRAYTNPLPFLNNSIANSNLESKTGIKLATLNADQLACLIIIRDEFHILINATPAQLEAYTNRFRKSLFTRTKRTGFGLVTVQTRFGKGLSEIFGYEKYFRSKASKGLWLAQKLNIKSCPYCNSQYTLTIRAGDNSLKARFQFDHFYSKKRCTACYGNSFKSFQQLMHYGCFKKLR